MSILLSKSSGKNLFILCLVFLSISNISSAQHTLNGIILDSGNNTPVKGALIKIKNSFQQTTTDVNGNFNFQDISSQNIELIISHIAYDKDTVSVNLPSPALTLNLNEHIYLSEEITISATRTGDESSIAHSNLNKTELSKYNTGQDLPYLLSLTPSLVVTSDAGSGIGYTGLRIRGSDATRINVTINGIPVNDAESHQVYWVDLPDLASSTDNIQIQRGLGTSSNGAGAFGGSINIQTTTLKTKPYASISSSAGSFNSYKNTLGFGSGLISDHFALDGNLSIIQTDGYIDRASSLLKSFYVSGGYYAKNSSLKAIIMSGREKTYQAWYGVPQDSLKTNRTFNPAGMYFNENGDLSYYDDQTDNYQQDNYQLIFTQRISSDLDLNVALHGTKGKGYYEEYSAGDPFSKYSLPDVIIGTDTIQYSDFIRQRWLDNDFYGIVASGNYQRRNYKITVGGAANIYSGDHYGDLFWSKDQAINNFPVRYYKDDAKKKEFNVYTKLNARISDKLELFADFQLRSLNYEFEGRSGAGDFLPQTVSYSFFNPKIGFSYSILKHQRLYVSAGVGQKEPVRDDFINSSENSRPSAEKLTDYEGGYQYKSGKIQIGLNYFYMYYRDQLILNGKINDVGEYTRQNVDKSYRTGLELELNYSFTPKLSFAGNFTLSKNKIELYSEYVDDYDEGIQIIRQYPESDIAFSPTLVSAGRITWSIMPSLQLDFSGKFVGKQYLDNTQDNAKQLDAYLLNDLGFRYAIHLHSLKELGIKLQVNNIFDTEYSSNGYTYSYKYGGELSTFNYYYPQAGRNFMVAINLLF